MNYEIIETMIRQDFESFTKGDVEPIPQYSKKKHIALATQITVDHFRNTPHYTKIEMIDFIHGLNHIFYYGVIAGQTMSKDNIDYVERMK